MSDTSGTSVPVNDGSDGSQGSATVGDNSDSLASPFLANIPEADRGIVSKYISDWDKQVTQRFQKIHDDYRPYKDSGLAPQDLTSAAQVYRLLQEDPRRVYDALRTSIEEEDAQEAKRRQALQDQFGGGMPPEGLNKIAELEKQIQQTNQFIQQQQAQQAQQKQLSQVEAWINQLHKDHGEFDNDYVLAKALRGVPAEQAIKEFQALVQPKNQRPVPPILNGGGSTAHNNVDPAKLDRKGTVDLVAAMLQQAHQS